MDPAEERPLRERLELLNRLDYELSEQDTLARERSAMSPSEEVSGSQRSVLRAIFNEVEHLRVNGFFVAELPPYVSVTAIRPTIRSVRAKVVWERKRVRGLLGMPILPGEGAEELRAESRAVEAVDQGEAKRPTKEVEEPAIQAARISSKQAIVVALITAVSGVAAGWLSHGSSIALGSPIPAQQRFIKLTGIEGHGHVRIVVEVNGQAYSYPSRAVWAEVGPQMSTEVFPLAIGASEFTVHISGFSRSDDGQVVREDSSNQNQRFGISSLPVDADYPLYEQDIRDSRYSTPNIRVRYSMY